ncbi:Serine/threonine-protein phosphatase 2A activator 2 [Glutinoglossum americanum]|uniref:Serine/threonine-protein phosphatase 2A activator n=1 Tax=Glutinoglossum americanum TaxID=1670608 RepID=A0A9P8ICV0_9PEZI|nr:Serine/threonine-protein phosphatase 2A activator 2 [Glutinoglossum americanum]
MASININTITPNGPVPGQQLPRLTPRRRQPPPSNPIPAPETPPLPPPLSLESHKFTHPTRRILSTEDHKLFLSSPTYTLITSFVFSLADTVKDTPISAAKVGGLSPAVQCVLDILDDVEKVVERCPPEDQGGSRFGNKAFRDVLDAVGKEHEGWHRKLGMEDAAAIDEVSTYFLQAFGNRSRIDYGSGHELNFIVWLLCLYQLHIIQKSDLQALVLRVFTRYLLLMRLIQSTYYLEPAGSHGVWGLDDYQFLPFLFGASQLLHHPFIRPLSIHQNLILEESGPDYIYLNQVAFINSVKNVEGLRWHSPMLDDISAAKSWEKVEVGMKRMFIAEVLKKLPVMQHFLFGSLIPAVDGMSTEKDWEGIDEGEDVVVMEDGMKHVHHASSWGDCCGIKVPSSIGAAQEMKKRTGGEELRRVPFD